MRVSSSPNSALTGTSSPNTPSTRFSTMSSKYSSHKHVLNPFSRLKAFEMPDIAPLLALMYDVIHWKNKPLSFLIWIGTMAAVHSFEPWMIPAALVGVLIVGRVQPSLFVKKKVILKSKILL